ncbi:MAG: hypothetical protein HRT71_06630, partial [Flavobacteriales bacterium]|nr:hypothetical protein [Flavobacteriales bacterium]
MKAVNQSIRLISLMLFISSFAGINQLYAQANTHIVVLSITNGATPGIVNNLITTDPFYPTAGFTVGEQALIIQMKGATVVETNGPGYGSVTNYGNAGTWEFATVLSVTATTVELDVDVSDYDITKNVQLVSVPPQAGDYVEDGSGIPQIYDGFVGGVYAISICGTYTLTGDLGFTDNNLFMPKFGQGGGFRGGGKNLAGDFLTSEPQQWMATDLFDADFGSFKGEGIASTYCYTDDMGYGSLPSIDPDLGTTGVSSGGWAYSYVCPPGEDCIGMGMGGGAIDAGFELCSVHDLGVGGLANGGGGGGEVDGGGGGGSNGGAGGLGGCGWHFNYDCPMNNACVGGDWEACDSPPPLDLTDVQGQGGHALAIPSDGSRLFFGGGGGSGWTDAAIGAEGLDFLRGSGGVPGGGIFIIQATQIDGGGNTIRADGADHTKEIIWQANGGGGAGGTIYIDAPVATNLNLSARGGYGGNAILDMSVGSYDNYSCSAELGPGGGGSGGVIITPVITPVGPVYIDVSGGAAGMWYEYNGCNNYCAGGGGTTLGEAGNLPYPSFDDGMNNPPGTPDAGYIPGSPDNLPLEFNTWCSEGGQDGQIIERPIETVLCRISELKALECGGGVGSGADLQVEVEMPPCVPGAPIDATWYDPSSNFIASSGQVLPELGTHDIFDNQTQGIYTVIATDINGNTGSCEFEVLPPNPVFATIGYVVDPTCSGDTDGELHASGYGGVRPYTWDWGLGALSDSSRKSVPAGNYVVTITDNNQCTSTNDTTITDPSSVVIIEDNYDDETCVDFCDGFINLTGSGGTYLDVVTSKTFTYGGGDGTTIVGKEIS